MNGLELEDFSAWLNLTKQQFDIIKAVFTLQKEKIDCSPKNILKRYERETGSSIQKSNFFAQLKILLGRGLIEREDKARYSLSVDTIRSELKASKEMLLKEVDHFDNAIENVDTLLNEIIDEDKPPIVEFFSYDEMLGRAAQLMKHAEKVYVTGAFPRIYYHYSRSLSETPGAKDYAETLWRECIEKEKLKVTYLARFDINYLRTLFEGYYKDAEIAEAEIKRALRETEYTIKKSKNNLEVFFIDSHGVDLIIPFSKGTEEFFIMIRDYNQQLIGGIRIKSFKLMNKFREIFKRECKGALKVTPGNVSDVIRGAIDRQ